MYRRGMPNHRNAIAMQLMQQPQQQPMGGGMPQQPMGGGMPPPTMGGMDKPMPMGAGAGMMGAPIAPNANPMMPHQLTAGEWATGSGDASPASFANYQAGMGQTPAPAYAGAGSLSAGPGGMNMAGLNQPLQQQAAPQLGNGPPLFSAGGLG